MYTENNTIELQSEDMFDVDRTEERSASVMSSGEQILLGRVRASVRTNRSKRLTAVPFRGELAESMLFGHEKGAFTGAVSRAKGMFEHAHTGILFVTLVWLHVAHAL